MSKTLVECEPVAGERYVADYGHAIFSVKVNGFIAVAQGAGRVAVCTNLATNTTILLLASHLNRAVFYKVVDE